MSRPSLRGRLLVASPLLRDPNFVRTVVLMLAHEEAGALGVVLNRPTDVTVSELVGDWARLAAPPPVVFSGGPVAAGASLVCLARVQRPPPERWESIVGPLGTLDASQPPEDLAPYLDRVRFFSGYAGWDASQLDAELAAGVWHVVDADPHDALTASPERLWRFVLRRQGGRLAVLANFPPDPVRN